MLVCQRPIVNLNYPISSLLDAIVALAAEFNIRIVHMYANSIADLLRRTFALSVFLDDGRGQDRWLAPGTGRRQANAAPFWPTLSKSSNRS